MDVMVRAAYSVATLYMLLILLRWLAPWIELDLETRWLRWIPRVVDPFLNLLRRVLPPMGPADLSPLAALFVVWVIRALLTHSP